MKLNGLSVADVLRVEGTDKYEVLSYLLFPAGLDMTTAVADCRSVLGGPSETTLSSLVSDSWRAEIVVAERTLTDSASIPKSVIDVLQKALRCSGCLGAVCMFDGAFFSFDDLLSADMAEQTYAFAFREGAEVICMSTDVLTSSGWGRIVQGQREALGWDE